MNLSQVRRINYLALVEAIECERAFTSYNPL